MYLRIDKLQFELPKPKEQNPNGAAAVQELMGGRFGEMSTLMNYTTQSFNFRGKKPLKPYYELISNIAAEELGHIELVAATINALLAGPETVEQEEPVDPATAPYSYAQDVHSAVHRRRTGGDDSGLTRRTLDRRQRILEWDAGARPAA